ncbi:MAG: 16S rRNA (cytidine(1402)-2'-O)-methyltransferase [Alphaproteobacteria bacterium]
MKSGLYIIATPIGNMEDITLRALETLKTVDVVACEDTRVTSKLFSRYGIKTPLISYHDHNVQTMIPKIISRIERGEAIGLVSDAGTPIISDPGFKLVNTLLEHKLYVTTIPGASAATSALTLSGIASDKFMFAGFPPPKTKARCDFFNDFKNIPATLIFYESPKRLLASLQDMLKIFGDRECAVIREITKIYEEINKNNLGALVNYYENSDTPRGEIVIVVSRLDESKKEVSQDEVISFLKDCLQKGISIKDASQMASTSFDIPKKEAYQTALKIKE